MVPSEIKKDDDEKFCQCSLKEKDRLLGGLSNNVVLALIKA